MSPNYSHGKIYKLVSKDGSHDLVYIGSTCKDLKTRLAHHKSTWKRYRNINSKPRGLTSCKLFDKGEVDIILLEYVNAKTKEELEARERHHILNNKCVNKIIPGICVNPNVRKARKPIEEDEFIRKFREDHKNIFDGKLKKETCVCGWLICVSRKLEHLKSKRHIDFINKV